MSGLYKLCSNLILKTPTWIFDNQWFKDTTLIFSSAAIGITSSLTALEGVRRMFSGLKPKKSSKDPLFKWLDAKPMDLKEIAKRWGIASLGMLSVPWLFKTGFKGLNWLSDQLIGMNVTVMDSAKLMQNVDWFNVITMGVFDIVLIATLIPTLWKNGRRFFDLLMLGLVSPLAMTAWIFDSHRSKFDQWWSSVKELSLVQIYHALFLLVIGWFIYGIPTPADPIGMTIKLLVVIGGFARMIEPPKIFNNHLNPKGIEYEDPKEVAGDVAHKVSEGVKNTVALAKGPVGIAERLIGKKFISTPLKRKVRVWKREQTFLPPLMRAPKPKKVSKPTSKTTPRRRK
jgi:hypothetical protein